MGALLTQHPCGGVSLDPSSFPLGLRTGSPPGPSAVALHPIIYLLPSPQPTPKRVM